MKKTAAILLICFSLFGLMSCSSKKQATAEQYIAGEMAKDKKAKEQLAKSCTKRLIDEAYGWKGVPYRAGGHSKSGTDCSGFIMEVFRSALGIELPRNSLKQSEHCTKISKSELEPGDLVFFHTTKKKGKISHVGLYVGNGNIIHASTHGVMVSGLDEPYYQKAYNHSGRVESFAAMRKKEKKKK